ncbi:MAG: hypothetical protein E7486_02120, partial [Ruminococcaceae bacterium]|nr:hypothetical protein [Oscillospiraceae bacterium]
MKRTPKSLLAILCSFAVLLSGLALWSSAAGTPEVLNPVVGTTYQLTGSAGLPGQSFDQQGDFGISYLAMDQGVLKEATYKAADNGYFYWDGADSVCSYIFPAQWENAMRAIPTATTYPVIAFTFPKTGTVNFTFGGASDPANSMTLYVTKNGVADADKLTATEGVYTEQVQAGDVFYCHCKPNNYTAGMYCAPGATVTYTAFAPEALNPELNTTYQLTGSAGLPGQSFDQQGDFGISYLAMDQGVLKEATYKAADNGYFYWDGADSVCSYIFPAQWENAMR